MAAETARRSRWRPSGAHCDIDYDAVGTWNLPFKAKIGKDTFTSPEAMRTGRHEKHSLVVGIDVFKDVAFPEKPETLYAPPDLRPRDDAAVVDAAQAIPNVERPLRRKRPLISAPMSWDKHWPIYGPRPDGTDEASPRVAEPGA